MENKIILILEDDPHLGKILVNALKKEDYKVALRENGEQGLDYLESEKPDLILLDLLMPQMDGLSFFEKLLAKEETKKIPVIVLTNLSRTDEYHNTCLKHAKDYITKANISIEDLLKKISVILNDGGR